MYLPEHIHDGDGLQSGQEPASGALKEGFLLLGTLSRETMVDEVAGTDHFRHGGCTRKEVPRVVQSVLGDGHQRPIPPTHSRELTPWIAESL
jgi:hypothetical protein